MDHSCQASLLLVESHKNMMVVAAILCPAVCVSDMNKTIMCGKSGKCIMNPTFFLSSLVKSTLRGLHTKERKKKQVFFCVTIDRTTKRSLQVEMLAHFLCFQPACVFSLIWFPFDCLKSTVPSCSATVLKPSFFHMKLQ